MSEELVASTVRIGILTRNLFSSREFFSFSFKLLVVVHYYNYYCFGKNRRFTINIHTP